MCDKKAYKIDAIAGAKLCSKHKQSQRRLQHVIEPIESNKLLEKISGKIYYTFVDIDIRKMFSREFPLYISACENEGSVRVDCSSVLRLCFAAVKALL